MILDSKEYRELFSVLDLPQYREWAEIVEDYLLFYKAPSSTIKKNRYFELKTVSDNFGYNSSPKTT